MTRLRRWLRRLVNWSDRHWLEFFGISALGLIVVIVLWPLIFYNVPPGHVGVMWYRFLGGTDTRPDHTLGEGLHVIFPWDKIYIYDARLQRLGDSVTGLSTDGLDITMNVSARFVVQRTYAGYLHKALGPNFPETLMRPQLRTLTLTYISENDAADLYSTRRSQIQKTIEARFRAALSDISTNVPFQESYVKLEDLLIEEIKLPPFVSQAIAQKEKVRHLAEAYEFRLQLEERERQRKRIEADGIRSFQEIVAPGITESYLRWRGIEATLQLSQSKNAKVVIIGNGGDGLPIILNTDSAQGVQSLPDGQAGGAAGDRSEALDPQFAPVGDPALSHPLENLYDPGAQPGRQSAPHGYPPVPGTGSGPGDHAVGTLGGGPDVSGIAPAAQTGQRSTGTAGQGNAGRGSAGQGAAGPGTAGPGTESRRGGRRDGGSPGAAAGQSWTDRVIDLVTTPIETGTPKPPTQTPSATLHTGDASGPIGGAADQTGTLPPQSARDKPPRTSDRTLRENLQRGGSDW